MEQSIFLQHCRIRVALFPPRSRIFLRDVNPCSFTLCTLKLRYLFRLNYMYEKESKRSSFFYASVYIEGEWSPLQLRGDKIDLERCTGRAINRRGKREETETGVDGKCARESSYHRTRHDRGFLLTSDLYVD